jgi:hypothetical protein
MVNTHLLYSGVGPPSKGSHTYSNFSVSRHWPKTLFLFSSVSFLYICNTMRSVMHYIIISSLSLSLKFTSTGRKQHGFKCRSW